MQERPPYFLTWSAQHNARPLPVTGGEGCYFTTDSGERWLDLGSMTYHVNAGHGERRIIDAVKAQADQLCVSMPNADFPAKRLLAEKLLQIAPPGFSRVFFTLGGSEAVENAIKIARMVTGRYKLISRYRAYHGATLGAVSLSGDYRRPPVEPALVGALHAMDCYCDRCPFGQQPGSCRLECATHIADMLDLEGPRTVAAVFMEPVVGANGVLIPAPGYWQRVRDACDQHGTLLVADEVLTGFGRTGRWLGLEHQGVTPDLITLSKGLTSGYGTLGAILVHDRIAQHFDHNVLYAGLTGYAHPLACAAALAAIQVYEDDGLVQNAAALEPLLRDELTRLRDRFAPHARFVRAIGLLGAIEFDAPEDRYLALKAALTRRRVHAFVQKASRCLILAPPLCIDEDTLKLGIQEIESALAEVFTPQGDDTP